MKIINFKNRYYVGISILTFAMLNASDNDKGIWVNYMGLTLHLPASYRDEVLNDHDAKIIGEEQLDVPTIPVVPIDLSAISGRNTVSESELKNMKYILNFDNCNPLSLLFDLKQWCFVNGAELLVEYASYSARTKEHEIVDYSLVSAAGAKINSYSGNSQVAIPRYTVQLNDCTLEELKKWCSKNRVVLSSAL